MRLRLILSLVGLSGLLLLLLLTLPLFALLFRAFKPDNLGFLFQDSVLEALKLSLMTTSISVLIIVILGTPIAYVLARYQFWGSRWLDSLLDLPLVLPPVVAGLALLLVFGRKGFLGPVLQELGVSIAFSTAAVILAQIFIASPLYIRAMKAGFASIPRRLEQVSLTLGKGPLESFWRITLPLSLPHLIEGIVLAWARALGEFGATIIFAGSLAGRTRTMPLAIYGALEQDLDASLAIAAILTISAFILLFFFRFALDFLSSPKPVKIDHYPKD
ncbi:MAG: ABC transporter permease [Deinococcales bacterium]